MSEKIFKVSGEEFRKQYKEAYESGRASLVDKMPAEFLRELPFQMRWQYCFFGI